MVRVKRGESRDVVVPLTGVKSSAVTLTLYVDKGHSGRFESDSMDPDASPDRPVFANGAPVAVKVHCKYL